ncbi:MAG: amidohydrolase family protein [Chloroflexi bacterium]|nr:amidohydrolase family protein [Chloroflexota bacterium]
MDTGNRSVLARATLIDGTGAAPVLNATVVVEGDRIAIVAQGRPEELGIQGDAVDLAGAFVLPGLIDMHFHATHYYRRPDAASYTGPMIAMMAAWRLRNALQQGTTTARDAGGVHKLPFDVKRGLGHGFSIGPRYYVSGNLIIPSGGHCANHQLELPGLSVEWDGPWGARQGVREQIRAGADFIKLANALTVDFTLEEMQAAVDEAHRLGYRVACHATTPYGCKTAVQAGVDTIEHGYHLDEGDVEQMAKKGIALDPTMHTGEITQRHLERTVADPRTSAEALGQARRALEQRLRGNEGRRASFHRALAAGVRITAGTDFNAPPECDGEGMADEVISLAENGCPAMRAIQAATGNAAAAMGWEKEIGTVAVGKKADLIVVAGDPLADIRKLKQVTQVMLGGKIVYSPGGQLSQARRPAALV